MQVTLYIDREDYKSVEEEERNNFIRDLLERIGIPIEDVWRDGDELTVERKIALKQMLSEFEITILSQGGNVEIYVGDELIGRWNRPRYKLKIDNKQIDPAKKLFFEMILDFDSVFAEDEWSEDKEEGEV